MPTTISIDDTTIEISESPDQLNSIEIQETQTTVVIEDLVAQNTIEIAGIAYGGSSSGNGLSDQFVYDPDEENPANNVYNDFALMMEKVNINSGRKYVTLKSSINNIDFPEGTWDVSYVTFNGNGNPFISGTAMNLTIGNDVFFSDIEGLEFGEGILVMFTGDEPAYVNPSGKAVTVKYVNGAGILAMTSPIFKNEAGGFLFINAINGVVGNPKWFFGTGSELIEQEAGGQIQVFFGGVSSMVTDDFIKGAGTLALVQQGSEYLGAEVFGGPEQPGITNFEATNENFAGTTNRVQLSKAYKVGTDPIDGVDADDVQEALEQLARTNGVADIGSVGYDISDKISSLSGYWSGNIFGKLFLTRNGRTADGFISIIALADAVAPDELPELPLTTFFIRGEDLPFAPKNFGNISEEIPFPLTEPGGFGILQNQIDEMTANSSAVGSAASNFGGLLGEIPAVIFFNVSNETAGGLATVVWNNNPLQIVGAQWNLFARVRYEIAYAEGEEPEAISLSGTFENGVVGEAYEQFVDIIGETEEVYIVDFTVGGGGLPDGLSMEIVSNQLRLYGTPTTANSFSFTVALEDNLGNIYSPATFSLDMAEAPPDPFTIDLSGFTIPTFHVGHQKSVLYVIGLEDNSQNPLSQVEVISGSLPAKCGLYITSSNHKIQFNGKPNATGTYNFRIRVTDVLGNTAEKDMVCEVTDIGAPVLNPEADPDLYLGTWSPNSQNINFTSYQGGSSQNIDAYTASEGEILKIRSASTYIIRGGSYYWVNIDDYIIFQNGLWSYYNYS